MKRYANILLLSVLFIAAGCIEEKLLDPKAAESEIDQLVPGKELSIQATREGGLVGETKTTRVPASGAVLWTPGDAISLFYGSGTAGGSRFESNATENSDVTNFTGTITAITGGANIDPADTYFWGVYPYRDDTSCDGTSITMTLPSQQTAVPGSFATNTFPSIGKSQGLVMGFYNVCGGWWFSVTKEGVRKVTIKSNGGEAIAGTVKVALNSSGIPQVTEIVDGSDEVVLECPRGEYFEVGVDYYVILLPGVLPSGFTMTFETYTESGVYNRTKSTTITRSNFGGIPSLDTYLTTPYAMKTGNIPIEDANFKAYLVSNFDTNSDGEISYAEADAITSIDVQTDNIASVQGIEYMTRLSYLRVSGSRVYENGQYVSLGQLTSLDVSNNTALISLDCRSNQLTLLDVSNNTSLNTLNCGDFYGGNQLTSLDVSHNTALTRLECRRNQLTSLDLSNSTELTFLECSNNQLTTLDVSHNTALIRLYCGSNQLTSLDVSHNIELTLLNCGSNQLTSLDVSHNIELTLLNCEENRLTLLDVSNNTALTSLYCRRNCLTSLDVNAALTYLECQENSFTSLDFSLNTALEYLTCFRNKLTTLDVSNNTALTSLSCSPMSTLETLLISQDQVIPSFSIPSTTQIVVALGDNANQPIQFADAEVKRICVENWDTNCDGELSYSEAAAVTDLGNAFRENYLIASFDELQYFTGLTEIGSGAFDYCFRLASVYIPNSVISIGSSFSGCQGLQSFNGKYSSADGHSLVVDGHLVAFAPAGISEYTVPSDVTIINSGAMSGNSRTTFYSLERIIIPEGVTCIESDAIGSFAHVSNITLPNSLVSIGDNNFMYCREMNSFSGKFSSLDGRCLISNGRLIAFASYGLTEYEIPIGVTEICIQAFYSYQNITKVILPDTVEVIDSFAFAECKNLETVTLSSSLSTLGFLTFHNCIHLTEITLPASISKIDAQCFDGCTGLTAITVINPTPPSNASGSMFLNTNDCPIYVPNEAVEAYKAALGWSNYADRIFGI